MASPIFVPLELRLFASEFAPSKQEFANGLSALRKLMSRQTDGTLKALAETRIEQSFNERLFAEIFGYKTLLRHGSGDYHLQPKTYHANRRYDDFALGFFNASSSDRRVLAELKSPETDLDKPQSGAQYAGMSPVQQAFSAASTAHGIRWIIVSNFDEMRLYRNSNQTEHEAIFLSDILTRRDFWKAHALFSKKTLIGDGELDSPLDLLAKGKRPMIPPKISGRVRLIHEAVIDNPTQEEAPLHQMDDALRAALACLPIKQKWWPKRAPYQMPELVDERLVIAYSDDHGNLLSSVELTRLGMLRISEYLEIDPVDPKQPEIQAKELAASILLFVVFAGAVIQHGFGSVGHEPPKMSLSWDLRDISDAVCGCPSNWIGINVAPAPRVPRTVDASSMPRRTVWVNEIAQHVGAAEIALAATQELLFPFEIRHPTTKAVDRIRPSLEQISALASSLAGFRKLLLSLNS